MSLNDGKMDVDVVDKELVEILRKMFVFGFVDQDFDEYVKRMMGYYLLRNKDDGSYEFDLNILKKIVFVSVVKENVLFV